MRRSALTRRTPLLSASPRARTPLGGSRSTRRTPQPGTGPHSTARAAWKTPRWGRCENCGQIDNQPLHGHHCVARQTVARAGGDEWDPRNRMDLCAICHMNHEFGQANRKIPRQLIPEAAERFAADLLGEDVAELYFARAYAPEIAEGTGGWVP